MEEIDKGSNSSPLQTSTPEKGDEYSNIIVIIIVYVSVESEEEPPAKRKSTTPSLDLGAVVPNSGSSPSAPITLQSESGNVEPRNMESGCSDPPHLSPPVCGHSPSLILPAARAGIGLSTSLLPIPPETSFTPTSLSSSLPPWTNSSNYSGLQGPSTSIHVPRFWQYPPPDDMSDFGGSAYSRESSVLVSTIICI